MPLLQIDIEARYAQFRDAMNRIERQTQQSASNMSRAFSGVKTTLAGLGVTATAGALTSIVKNAIDAADTLNDLSKQTGVAIETLGGLGFAAGQAGGSLDSIAGAAGKLNKAIAGAAGGNKEFAEAFKKMGIDIEGAEGKLKTADQVLIELADKFATYADGPEKVAIAQRLLGESGAEMIGFLNDGGQAIQENIDFYQRFAGVTQETADRADAFNDSLGKLSALSSGFGQRLAAELLPTMEGIANALVEARENGDEFNNWAERAASVINGLAYVSVGGVQGLEEIANLAGLAANAMQALASGKPSEIAEAWRAYGEARQDSANDAHAGFQALKNPSLPDPTEPIVAKYDKQIAEEWSRFNDRNRALKKLRDEDQISEKDYQVKKLAAHREAVEETRKLIDSQISTLTDKKLNAKTPQEAANLQARIDAKHKEKFFAGEGKRPAPILSSGSKGKPRVASVDDLETRAADAKNRSLEGLSEREREILADRSEFLNTYYQQDLVSIKDYYAGRRVAQDEALRAQEANINQEIANLEALKPKDARGRAEVDGKLEALIERRSQLQEAAGKAAIQLSIDETRAAKDFQDALAGINAELLEQQGLLPQAAGARFDMSNERLKTRLTTERDAAATSGDADTAAARSADLDKLARLRALAVARAELNSLEEVATQVQFKLTAATVRAEIGAKSGATSEIESLRAVSDARLQAVADLQQVATALDAVARSTGDARMLEQAKALQLEVEELAASADLVRERFEDAFTGPFESALEKMISGTASFKDVIKGLFSDIASEFTRMAAQDFTKQLLGSKGALGGMVDFTARMFGGESKVPSASADVASALSGTAGSAGAAAAAAQVATLGAAATGASTAMGVLSTGALPSLVVAAEAAAAALANVAASGGSNSVSGLASLFSSSGSSDTMDYAAAVEATGWFRNGGIFAGGDVVPFAKGGIPGIISAPTYFPMKDGGTGLMGEAGPEAIMPLARDPGGELAVRMVGARGEIDLLPVTRDSSGRMAVRAPAKAFANGGVFGGGEPTRRASVAGIIDQASSKAAAMRVETLAVPIGQLVDQGGAGTKGGDTHLTVNVTPPAGTSRESASQWGAVAGRQIQRSMKRNT